MIGGESGNHVQTRESMSAIAVAVSGVLFVLAALHVYWAVMGVAVGSAVPSRSDGTPLFRPSRATTMTVALALCVAGVIVLGRSGLAVAWIPESLFRIGIWGVALAFGARAIGEFRYVGLFKRERRSAFARLDTLVFTPLCAALAVGAAVIATS